MVSFLQSRLPRPELRLFRRMWFALALVLGLAGALEGAVPLRFGMTPEEVTGAVGQPSSRAGTRLKEVWIYPEGRLAFFRGRLEHFSWQGANAATLAELSDRPVVVLQVRPTAEDLAWLSAERARLQEVAEAEEARLAAAASEARRRTQRPAAGPAAAMLAPREWALLGLAIFIVAVWVLRPGAGGRRRAAAAADDEA